MPDSAETPAPVNTTIDLAGKDMEKYYHILHYAQRAK